MESLRANYENTISSYHPSSGSDRFCSCCCRVEFCKRTEHAPETNMTSETNATMGGNMTGTGNMTNASSPMMTNSS